ncbi:MAG: C_GCAxxG_C_C family protein [Spirochaetales bacterium]|nr:C_GCAxxG_C_C family protein [Spirochaetales bacterium]
MKKEALAVNKFKDGYNCAQSMIYSFADDVGIDTSIALKLSSGFGGGMGRKGNVCGAVTGAILIIGLIYGRGENEDRLKQEETYKYVREFINRFEKKYDTIECKSLIDNIDLLSEEGQNKFKESKMIYKCCEYIESANRIIQEMIK